MKNIVTMPKVVVYFDMDGPLADFDIGMGHNVGHPKRGVFEKNKKKLAPMYKKGFFRNLPVTEGAKEAVKEILSIERLDCYIATKPMVDGVMYSASEKFDWLNEHFPELVQKTFMTCCKGHLNGHYLIDDHAEKWEPIFGGTFLHFDVTNPESSWEEIVDYLRKYDPSNFKKKKLASCWRKVLWRPVLQSPEMMGYPNKKIQLHIAEHGGMDITLATIKIKKDGTAYLIHYRQDSGNEHRRIFDQMAVEAHLGNSEWKQGMFNGNAKAMAKNGDVFKIRDVLKDGPWPKL